MGNIDDLTAKDSEQRKAAESRLLARVQRGAEQQKEVIEKVMKTVIVDRLVPPSTMEFGIIAPEDAKSGALYLRQQQSPSAPMFSVHTHALNQMASVVLIPRAYVSHLNSGPKWKQELLCTNFNTLFHKGIFLDRKKQPMKFLHRIVGGEVRGFLSRNYNRKLVTAPLLRAFVESCGMHRAGPVEALATDIRVSLKCMLPYVFEPVHGEFISFGVTFSNSDFGAGRTKVSGTVMRITSGTITVLEDALSRVHLGSVIEESDLELSNETADKELATHRSAIKDVIEKQLGYENIERSLKLIEVAHDHKIAWHTLKNQLMKGLNKQEIGVIEELLKKSDANDIIDLPPPYKDPDGEIVATAWWAANVVGWMASREEDNNRKQDLQQLAGEILIK